MRLPKSFVVALFSLLTWTSVMIDRNVLFYSDQGTLSNLPGWYSSSHLLNSSQYRDSNRPIKMSISSTPRRNMSWAL
ncbi:hypothetical protein BJ741DRAFT_637837 [Chytriomyces cf. hyalinus JEL632]|nr:hypothetical protein BJ741DRAFT_637837 [Chytriomyces cf. hyalinus JEL632]